MSEEKKENKKNELSEDQLQQVSGGSKLPPPEPVPTAPKRGSVDHFFEIVKKS